MLGQNCFEEKDFRHRGKTIFFRENSERFITPTVKENFTTKTKLLVLQNETNITRHDSRAREIIVMILETAPALFARRLMNFW